MSLYVHATKRTRWHPLAEIAFANELRNFLKKRESLYFLVLIRGRLMEADAQSGVDKAGVWGIEQKPAYL